MVEEVRLITFALMAFLNQVDEADIIEFFKRKVHCEREAALRAIGDARELALLLRSDDSGPHAFSVGMVRSLVVEFVWDRDKRIQREELEWEDTAGEAPILQASKSASSSSSSVDMELAVAMAASQLGQHEFLVRAISDYATRDSVREHDLRKGDVFVVSQVRFLDDDTNDAWFCGRRVGDSNRESKWIFSEYAVKVFS